jgi:hypothetical protein
MKVLLTVALIALALLSIAPCVNALDTRAFWEQVEHLGSGASPPRLAPSAF